MTGHANAKENLPVLMIAQSLVTTGVNGLSCNLLKQSIFNWSSGHLDLRPAAPNAADEERCTAMASA